MIEDIDDGSPWYNSEDCEVCMRLLIGTDKKYIHKFTWINGLWVCDYCNTTQ